MPFHRILLCLIYALISTSLSAQTSAGLVIVNVQDQTGAAVSGASG